MRLGHAQPIGYEKPKTWLPQYSYAPASVVFDDVGSGQTGTFSGAWSFQHYAKAGAYVVLVFIDDRPETLTNVAYAGVPMNSLGSIGCNNAPASNGSLRFYGLGGVPAGSQTVSGTVSTALWMVANTVSYLNVAAAALILSSFGLSAAPSSGSVVCKSGQMIVGGLAFGNFLGSATNISAPIGGSNRYLNTVSNNTSGLSISDATATTTFTATLSTATDPWAGGGVLLTPPPILAPQVTNIDVSMTNSSTMR
jgi:hypothetical protein